MGNTDFSQSLNRHRMDITGRSGTSRKRPPVFTVAGVDNCFSHLRTARVTGAKKEHCMDHLCFGFQNSESVALISTNSPVTMNTVRSQILVTRSAKRSRL